MIDPKIVEEIVKEGIQETDLFVVDITVTPDNRIVVEIDNDEGVDIDRCMSCTISSKAGSTEMSKITNSK